MRISARNTLPGTIVSITKGPVSTEVELEIAPGLFITSSITTRSVESLNLQIGSPAYAIIKASSVMVGVDD